VVDELLGKVLLEGFHFAKCFPPVVASDAVVHGTIFVFGQAVVAIQRNIKIGGSQSVSVHLAISDLSV